MQANSLVAISNSKLIVHAMVIVRLLLSNKRAGFFRYTNLLALVSKVCLVRFVRVVKGVPVEGDGSLPTQVPL